MNQTQQTTRPSRFRSLTEDLFGPMESTPSPVQRRLLLVRSALAHFTLIATLVQVVVLTLADHWHGWYAAAPRTDSTQEVTR